MLRSTYFVLFILAGYGNGSPIQKFASISMEEVIFQLYTAEDANVGTRIYVRDASSVNRTTFDPSLPTKVLIHGWMDDLTGGFQNIRKEFLLLEPMNVISVDWSACSKVLLYEQTIECAKQVGTYAGDLIQWLTEETNLSLKNVHVIGHSLGGQVISFVSRVLKVGRISALDPAGPLFTHVGPENRIDPTDADFIDVIHTSTRVLGITYPVGHIDFYVNGGLWQPGCINDVFGHCAHTYAHVLYAETISKETRNEYIGFKCSTMEDAQNQTCAESPQVVMGYGVTPGNDGIYSVNIPEMPSMD